jgi:hypothetical protein
MILSTGTPLYEGHAVVTPHIAVSRYEEPLQNHREQNHREQTRAKNGSCDRVFTAPGRAAFAPARTLRDGARARYPRLHEGSEVIQPHPTPVYMGNRHSK